MSVSFLAFGNDSSRKAEALALVSGAADSAAGRGFVERLTGAPDDLAGAHALTGFPADLLSVLDVIVRSVPAPEASDVSVRLAESVVVGVDVADLAELVLRTTLETTVARTGAKGFRRAAEFAPQFLVPLHRGLLPTTDERARVKASAKKARRQGLDPPSPEQIVVDDAVRLMFDRGTFGAAETLEWMLGLAPDRPEAAREAAATLVAIVADL